MKPSLHIEDILSALTEITGVPVDQIKHNHPKQSISDIKHVACYFGYFYSRQALSHIGEQLNTGYCLVHNGAMKIDQMYRIDFDIRTLVDATLKMLSVKFDMNKSKMRKTRTVRKRTASSPKKTFVYILHAIYPSITEASKATGVPHSRITGTGDYKSRKYVFRYA